MLAQVNATKVASATVNPVTRAARSRQNRGLLKWRARITRSPIMNRGIRARAPHSRISYIAAASSGG
jgi:hypothetical protein